MKLRGIALDAASKDCIQEQPVGIDTENILLMIAAQRDMIKTSG